jgi:CRISPR-associated protein Cas9/Csn1, subtype II/NMEMI
MDDFKKTGEQNIKSEDVTYVGLDIGTSSVGYAATDGDYKILKFRGRPIYGSRLFEDANTAAERRVFRCGRRRLDRRKERIKLSEEPFKEAVTAVDPSFFVRLHESKLVEGDRNEKWRFPLFDDSDGYTDKQYYKDFPTIYHLRKYVAETTKKPDIRLVYLAVRNILKRRGNFIWEGREFSVRSAFSEAFTAADKFFAENSSENKSYMNFNITDSQAQKISGEYKGGKNQRHAVLKSALGVSEKINEEIYKALSGKIFKLSNIFDTEEDVEKLTFDTDAEKYESEIFPKIIEIVGDEGAALISALKEGYDALTLSVMLRGHKTLSEARIAIYDKHKKDLHILKNIIHRFAPKEYTNFFSDDRDRDDRRSEKKIGKSGIYESYVKGADNNGVNKKTERKDFLKEVKKLLDKVSSDYPDNALIKKALAEIGEDDSSFLPKISEGNNGAVPYQLHLIELENILDNAAKFYPFINDKDSSGYTAKEKIIALMKFRIPYSVGPIGSRGEEHNARGQKGAWAARSEGREGDHITPWNFKEAIDEDKSGERFIKRMTSNCSYLRGEDALPKTPSCTANTPSETN